MLEGYHNYISLFLSQLMGEKCRGTIIIKKKHILMGQIV